MAMTEGKKDALTCDMMSWLRLVCSYAIGWIRLLLWIVWHV